MTTERIDIVVQEKGSRVVKRNLEDLGSSADAAGKQVDYAARAVGALTAALGVSKLIEYSDQLTAIEGRLRLVTNTTEQLTRVQTALFDMAQRTRQSFAGTTELYAKLAKATEDLGLSERKLLGTTELVNKTLIISGSSAAASQAALVQFAQGLSAGALRGEELNSILEQAPRLAQALADGLGRPVGALKQLGEAGELTTERIIAALDTQRDKISSEFGQLAPTIGQAFQVLNNELLRFVGEGAKTSGAAAAIASGIKLVADNLNLLAAAALGFGAAQLAKFILEGAAAAYTAVTAIQAKVAAYAADRAANLAAAQAEVAKTAATAQDTAAKVAQITATRSVTLAELARTNATIASAEAQIAASRAAGAQSFALASLRSAEQALTAAMATRAALTTELAALGVAQARATTAATAATTAATTATAGLATATAAAGVGSRIMAGALGLLGGPIGAIITVLGLGVTAWAAWGATSRKETADTTTEVKRSTGEILTELDKQIQKLDERNRLAKVMPSLGKDNSEAVQRLAELQTKIEDFTKGVGAAANLPEAARQAVLQQTLKDYVALETKISSLNQKQKEFEGIGQQAASKKWLEKYATDAEKLAAELAKAKKELGDAFSPDIEKRIRESFAKKGDHRQSPFAEELKQLKERAALVGLNTEMEKVNAEIALGKYGKLTPAQQAELRAQAAIIDAKRSAIELGKEEEAARKRTAQIAAQEQAAKDKDVESLIQHNQALRDEIETMGLSEQAKLAVESARMSSLITIKEEELAVRMSAEGNTVYAQTLEREINLLKQRQDLLRQKSDRAGQIASQEAEDKTRKAAQQSEQVLSESIANGLLEGFRKGQSITDIFLRELKAQFAKTVLTPMIQPVVSAGNQLLQSVLGNIFGAISGSFGGTPIVGATGDFARMDRMMTPMATGTNYVPFDNFPALLHKGEAVVPAEYNPKAGGQGQGAQINFNPVYQIDSRTDRAAVRQDMMDITQQSQEALVQQLRDSGVIA